MVTGLCHIHGSSEHFRDRSLLGLYASTFYSTSLVNIMGILKHNGNPLPEKGLRFRDDCSTGIKELCHVVLGVPKPCCAAIFAPL